jgi:hypothetical protein
LRQVMVVESDHLPDEQWVMVLECMMFTACLPQHSQNLTGTK